LRDERCRRSVTLMQGNGGEWRLALASRD
jgi:hypothetical protein